MEYKIIKLVGKHGKGKYTLVDGDYDGEYFSQYRWHVNSLGYVFRSTNRHENRGKKKGERAYIYLHHEVLHPVEGMFIDHINRDKLDNRSINLRYITKQQSAWNRNKRENSSNQYIGVHAVSKKTWSVVFDKKYHGSFNDEITAAKKWDELAFKKYGKFGVYNFL